MFKDKHLAFNNCMFLTLLTVSSSFNHLLRGRYQVLKPGNRTLVSPHLIICAILFSNRCALPPAIHCSDLKLYTEFICPKLNHPDFTQISTPTVIKAANQMLHCNICFGYAPDWEILERHFLHPLACLRSHHWTESTFSTFQCHWGGELAKI